MFNNNEKKMKKIQVQIKQLHLKLILKKKKKFEKKASEQAALYNSNIKKNFTVSGYKLPKTGLLNLCRSQ